MLVVGEIRIRDCDNDLFEMLGEEIRNPRHTAKSKGFGVAGMLINSLLKYEVVGEQITKNIQAITIRKHDVSIIGIYVSPCTKAEEESLVLENIAKINRGPAIIIDDLKAGSLWWEKVQ